MCSCRVVRVLGELEQLEGTPGIPRRGRRSFRKEYRRRLRPVDACLEDRVPRVGCASSVCSRSCSASSNSVLSISAFASKTAKRTASTGSSRFSAASRRLSEDRHRGFEIVQHRVRPAERVPPSRVIGQFVRRDPACLFQPADRLAWVPPAECELAEPGKRACALIGVRRGLQRVTELLLCLLRFVEAKSDLRVDQARVQVFPFGARGEVILGRPRGASPSLSAAAGTGCGRRPRSGRYTRASSPETRAGAGSAQRVRAPVEAAVRPQRGRQHESISVEARGTLAYTRPPSGRGYPEVIERKDGPVMMRLALLGAFLVLLAGFAAGGPVWP